MFVDTNILIDALRGKAEAVSFLEGQSNLSVSVISVTELLAGVRDERERDQLNDFFTSFLVVPITEDVARRAGDFLQQFRKSHQIGIADALIAACVELKDDALATLNTKDFPAISARVKRPY